MAPDEIAASTALSAPVSYAERHLGSGPIDESTMLSTLGFASLDELTEAAVPAAISLGRPLDLPPALTEAQALNDMRRVMSQNRVTKSYQGLGYVPAIMPAVVQRNVLENPGYYTQYTPYQAEIAQGRLEALLNFQTLVCSLTAMPLANASLLDEGTAAAEAMAMCRSLGATAERPVFVDSSCHPQSIEVIRTRAHALGIRVVVGSATLDLLDEHKPFCLTLQVPSTNGLLQDPRPLITRAHELGARVVIVADLLSLTLLKPPGELGADVAVGSTQRLGLPLGFGGPHAAYLATTEELKRLIPGRIVGVSRDGAGKAAIRLALQTREQHIRRERATSNICTAQVLPALLASFYAVYHGPQGLTAIMERCVRAAQWLAAGLVRMGHTVAPSCTFDTLCISVDDTRKQAIIASARERLIELRSDIDGLLCVTIGETITESDLHNLLRVFAPDNTIPFALSELGRASLPDIGPLRRASEFLTEPVFNSFHTEHEMLRYMRKLESRDLSLTTSMIPLGSCTMKLNATAAMMPLSWPEISQPHPFTDPENVLGYKEMIQDLEHWLAEVSGFSAVSLQPNSGAQGEYTGLLVIGAWHARRAQGHRRICLIPTSAHGTNPASATLAGLKVVPVACDAKGNVDVADLRQKAQSNAENLSCLMVTYPSTHGVFEENIQEICSIVHQYGGQVYLDGANMNAQVGLCRPGDYGADVCHINLHKTFAIPHGGGGPGMGPIAVAEHLKPFLPRQGFESQSTDSIGFVSSAPYGSASVLSVSWMYMRMLGPSGLKRASQVAILNANYMSKRLEPHYPVLFRGNSGLCAHEFIIDARGFKKTAGIEVDDIAKRLMDYGFHAPTMSFPVPGTLMIEPTESESLRELDRFCDAMISIREEIRAVENGHLPREDNPLKNAPHTAESIAKSDWSHPYSREQAVYPSSATRDHKFWPSVGRIDNAAGDRSLICTCPPM